MAYKSKRLMEHFKDVDTARKAYAAKDMPKEHLDMLEESLVEDAAVKESRDPMHVINKFLSDKDKNASASARRGERLRKERDARLAKDEEIDEAAYKPGITKIKRGLSFNDFEHHKGDEDYATVKKIKWPYGIDVKFNDENREVIFYTAKMRTVARILDKHIDFDTISAAEALDLPLGI